MPTPNTKPKAHCPKCSKSGLIPADVKPGDFTICLGCDRFLRFDEQLCLVELDRQAMEALPLNVQVQLMHAWLGAQVAKQILATTDEPSPLDYVAENLKGKKASSFRIAETKCPKCGVEISGQTSFGGTTPPHPGRVLPSGWRCLQRLPNASIYLSLSGLKVFVEVELQTDRDSVHCRLWLHLSVSRENRIPTYAELCEVKGLFIGDERKAIQVMPNKSEHYNFHPFCLHLWAPLEHDPLPDFRTPQGIL